jgi:hypothetical protein
MKPNTIARTAAYAAAAAAALATASYAAYVAVTWSRYGRVAPLPADERDALLDRFMPTWDVREHHQIRVAAPAAVTAAAARTMALMDLPVVRALVKARELLLGAQPFERTLPHALVAQMQAIGWGVLADVSDREIVMGAVTRPWDANVVFHAVSPNDFSAFQEPNYVKIAWTLRADPIDGGHSMFSTETRAIATDAVARERFRRYWAFLSPGIILIRIAAVIALRSEVERQGRRSAAAPQGGRV